MKDIKHIMRRLQSLGFRIEYGNGSKRKVFPPQKELPIYMLHEGDSKAIKPLSSFARKNWGLDLNAI